MIPCDCKAAHALRTVVLTGGPGAGKTAALELVRQTFCEHVHVLPESAGIIFGGGFPRKPDSLTQRAAQRAIYHVQNELESLVQAANAAVVVCDRGTVDGLAYWPGPGDFWSEVGTTLGEQLARYDVVIHLRTPHPDKEYNHKNPLRIETAVEAAAIDDRIADAWSKHPRRYFVERETEFLTKAMRVLDILRREVPPCCRDHIKWPDE